ncbi:bifunctional methionine sulfoxide reductase B/A protein [Shewanella sp. CG12_big_fil_rev_8_21_14_0_65_47_15]|uniref:bifunctional methionine sulfoxide reductase B/A protein n=1 Tax=Shewanella sp. CG12_big_fil_rev_8_21_14_0_65_47_15 TaxID=1975537 RepID=UPI000CAA65C5|nr:bifunctional methionine sulfoxide reductase B/A protein [Shewanella sp. CG12_big_fil_rev_8_21_14_0_65_47_15]PIW59219.1 MAG: peptide-methionine (S)-S-oxide reductase [Shewanella sp. CG12_big_fil_rev_8_21_14_0_65_47_15]
MNTKLTDFERYVIEEKGTERPFSGEYYQHDAKGVYLCKKCHAPLYRSEDKFNAHCGWPAFDDEIPGAVRRHIDADGRRTEIVCSQCGGHLGHVFEGEYLTPKNIRHCVNSVSMVFKATDEVEDTAQKYAFATFGAGCFWCVEAIFKSLKGVINVTSGYSGGEASDADYKSVCSGLTGHAEVVHIEFDPAQISFSTLLQVLFESHDPTTLNRQGNDKGPQYRSIVFAHTAEQIEQTNSLINQLTIAKVFDAPIVTQVSAFETFYPAEHYHNDYFALHGEQPYCQMVVRPKVEKVKALFARLQKA